MAATTVKNDPIRSDKMSFRTQMVNGKPQIFFDAIDTYAPHARSKRTGRTMSNASRLVEQQKNRMNTSKGPATQNGTNRSTNKPGQSPSKTRTNADEASNLGVYMTMDELAELVKAVKENAKSETKSTTEVSEPLPPQPPPPPPPETTTAPVVPKLELPIEPPARPPVEAPPSPREQGLSIIADKKRQKWLRERAEMEKMQMEIEYDQLKHQLSPRQKKSSVSPERSTFQYDFPPSSQPTHKPPPVPSTNKLPPPTTALPPAPPLPQSLKQNDFHHEVPPKVTEDVNSDGYKTRLMEQKQQQWKQENSEKMPLWNPFGRPGAGAPNSNENHARLAAPPSNPMLPYRAPAAPMQTDRSLSSVPSTFVYSDQSRVPAAMRTNLLFGDVRFDDDVRTAKELERRQWLDDLQKQVDDNKRQRYTLQEFERRKDFLNENVQPIVQEAENRRLQQNGTSNNNKNFQQNHDRSFEDNDPGKYDKRTQLIDKLKRNGFQTDGLTRTQSNGQSTNQRTGEKLFGPDYDVAPRQNNQSRVEPLHLNVNVDPQHSYRAIDVRRDEAVNTVDTTFRSDHNGHTDYRAPSRRQAPSRIYEEPDLPSELPNPHYQNSGYRSIPNQPGKNNPRVRPYDDNHASRRTSTSTYHSNLNDDRTTSQISHARSHQPPMEIHHRPLWNYNNPQHREYVPNSKRDPHYEKRQRLKHFEQGNYDRIDDVQKKTCYNRWNSDSELQNQQKKPIPTNRIRSTVSKATSYGNHKDESIMNLLKMQQKQQQTFGSRKSAVPHTKTDEETNSNHESSVDKYDNYVPYTRTDEVIDPGQVQSSSPETTSNRQTREAPTDGNYQQNGWNENHQSYPVVQPSTQSREEHILQQLSAIKENLIRRQRQLAT